MIQTFVALLIVALLVPAPAAAEPVTAAIALALGGGTAAVAAAGFIVRLGVSFIFSALASALAGKPAAQRPSGIKTDVTTTGGVNAESFILGRYATAGNLAAPPYSHPNDGSVPNQYLTYVIDIADKPGVTFNRMILNGEYITDWQASDGDHDQEGVIENSVPHVFLTWHDGTQVAADAYMMANYDSYPDRPWTADMVGAGITYAVVTFRYNRELFNSLPGVRFEVDGVPLYDPRADTTVGGSGAQRWDDPETWTQTTNPAVMIYNILRGIALSGGRSWGGKVAAEDLPLDNWFAAMNECDVVVSLKSGGSQKQYRAGLEVAVDAQPSEVIDDLLNACSAEMTEFGGVYKIRVGPPALPTYVFSDDDIILDRPEVLRPYPGLEGVFNAVHADFPSPAALWESRDAPPRYDTAAEAEDGRQLVADVSLPAVYDQRQVQRLTKAWLADSRRFRQHSLALPPEAVTLEPLDTVSWTSVRHSYSAKLFEVGELSDDPRTLIQSLSIRERDGGDFAWVPASDEFDVFDPATAPVRPADRYLTDFTALGDTIEAPSGALRPVLRLSWDETLLHETESIGFEIERASDLSDVASGVIDNPLRGKKTVRGLMPNTQYRVRARILGRKPGLWTGWVTATTPNTLLQAMDIAEEGILSYHIDVPDFASLWVDQGHEDDRYARSGPFTYADAPASYESERVIEVSGAAGAFGIVFGPKFDIDPAGETFHFDYEGDLDGGSGVMFLQIQASTKGRKNFASGTYFSSAGGVTITSTARTRVNGTVTIPAGYRSARVQLVKGSDGTATVARFGRLAVYRQNAEKKIRNGNLPGVKIVNLDITGDKIADNAVSLGGLAKATAGRKVGVDTSFAAKIVTEIDVGYLSEDYFWTVSGFAEIRGDTSVGATTYFGLQETIYDPGSSSSAIGTVDSDASDAWKKVEVTQQFHRGGSDYGYAFGLHFDCDRTVAQLTQNNVRRVALVLRANPAK
ncbi:phage tail protein [Arenibacterium halophilum]|uniref:Tip attachment protein J domain-containing protein n=1 Tax=Arenibacterium halophilum TaxID=2583821 RepID=A0ABY2WX34_9RHOB|nr:phage tail protein [Arenibacterium halophilum]TMV07320.1 hypothetical protein FGK64_21965 [Arenibacterium halophilum]